MANYQAPAHLGFCICKSVVILANWGIIRHETLGDPSVKWIWLYIINQAGKVPGLERLDLNPDTSTLCKLKCRWDRHCTVSSQKAQATRITIPDRLARLKEPCRKKAENRAWLLARLLAFCPSNELCRAWKGPKRVNRATINKKWVVE